MRLFVHWILCQSVIALHLYAGASKWVRSSLFTACEIKPCIFANGVNQGVGRAFQAKVGLPHGWRVSDALFPFFDIANALYFIRAAGGDL